jgi:hypothetical protein
MYIHIFRMENFHILHESMQFEDRMSYEFMIALLDDMFGQHDRVIINTETECEKNRQFIKNNWKLIRQYYHVPDRLKYTQRCVRQTLIHIIDYLNGKYQFKQPIKIEHRRNDYREKGSAGKHVTDYWIEISLV